MDVFESIKNRRSIREYKNKNVSNFKIQKILNMGRFSPSGLNNQPWKFLVLDGEKKDKIAPLTKYSDVIFGANKIILIFLDKSFSYHYEKDIMAIGACIQNMLLAAYSLGLGTCWLGEILKEREKINKSLKLPKKLELEAVISVGYYEKSVKKGRKKLKELIIKL